MAGGEIGLRRETGTDESRRHDARELLSREKTQMLAVHPLELPRIEDRGLLRQPLDRKELDHLRNGHDLDIVPRRPAQ